MMHPEKGIPYDGFRSVLEMLTHADANFRDKILSNLRRRDPELCRRLEAHLRASYRSQPSEDVSRAQLERSQRAAHTRNYGL
jgi:hypothetical protein